jgi:hypothetical protein
MVDTFFVNAPGDYWFEVDTGCGMIYRDSFEVVIGSAQAFAIADTAVCVDALVNAPVAGGTWYNGSVDPDILINQAGDYWFEYYNATCDTTLRDSFEVVIHVPASYTIPDTSACNELNLTAPITGGVWSTGSGNSLVTITQSGNYWYELTDTCNITYRDSFEVVVSSVQAFAIADTAVCVDALVDAPIAGGTWLTEVMILILPLIKREIIGLSIIMRLAIPLCVIVLKW